MTIRERIRSAFRGEMPDRVPFMVYVGDIPVGETERKLRNAGMGMFRRVSVYTSYTQNIKTCREEFLEDGRKAVRNTIHTPVGSIEQVLRTGGSFGSSLRSQFYIKKPEDYKVVEFMIKNTFYKPNYENFLEIEKDMGEDGYVAGNLDYTPMQEMIILLMGPEQFAIDFYEHHELIDSLYETMLAKHREWYQIAAESPAEVVWYGDNTTSEMIGLERFQKYCVNCYNELASCLHPKGKLVAVHMDGKLDRLKHAIADSKVDIIEAFTPPPDGDLSVSEARAIWKDKVLWINYPASLHLKSPEEIRAFTLELLRQAVPGDRFLISNTENLTPDVWPRFMTTVSDVLKEKGRLPLKCLKKG